MQVRILLVDKREGNMEKKPAISFCVYPDQIGKIKRFAKIKGFHTPSILARKALFIYISQNSKGLDLGDFRDVSASPVGQSNNDP